jgi:hypothetical protein
MSVRIVRLQNGEDVIADVKEALNDETLVGLLLTDPYQVYIQSDRVMVETDSPQKINDVQVQFLPWAPLSEKNEFLLRLEQLVTLYNPHPEILERYNQIIGVNNNDSEINSIEPELDGVSSGESDRVG